MRIPIFGIIVVTFGVVLLLRQIRLISVDGYSIVLFGLLVYGGAMIIRSYTLNVRQSLYFGSLCFYSALVLLLGKYGVIEQTPFVYVPAFLIVFGLSFVMLYIFNMRDFHLLVPSAIFIGLGIAFMLTEVGYWYVGDVKEAISMYWPVALIVFGGLMLVRKKQRYQ
ncbi:MAG: LiaI-LiaF-like domain-containing protein [Bacteroidota bacterium]